MSCKPKGVFQWVMTVFWVFVFLFMIPTSWDIQHNKYTYTYQTETLIATSEVDEMYQPWLNVFGAVLTSDRLLDVKVSVSCTIDSTVIQAHTNYRSGDGFQQARKCSAYETIEFDHGRGYIIFVSGSNADRWYPTK